MAEEVNRRFKAGCGDVEVETRTRQAIAGKIQKRSNKEGERLEAERAKPTLPSQRLLPPKCPATRLCTIFWLFFLDFPQCQYLSDGNLWMA